MAEEEGRLIWIWSPLPSPWEELLTRHAPPCTQARPASRCLWEEVCAPSLLSLHLTVAVRPRGRQPSLVSVRPFSFLSS